MKLINKTILKNAGQIAKTIRARAFFLYVDALDEVTFSLDLPKDCKLIIVSQKQNLSEEENFSQYPHQLILPNIKLGSLALMKVSMAYAISTQLVADGEKVVFVCGMGETRSLDTMTVFEIGKENEIITTKNILGISDSVAPQVFEAALNLIMELAEKGREGKPVGTIFVIGDSEKVLQLSKQMIINPFKGYTEEERNILSPALKETIREFSALDGAFVIDESGVVLNAGRYLGASADGADVARGLGSRHMAAAGITALTKALALVISESTGDIRIYKNGSRLLEIEKK